MAEQEMLLDTDTIRAAVAGEKWAKDKVIEHYTPIIDELAVDEDMKQHLILKLLEELPHFPMEQEKKSAGRRGIQPRARRFAMLGLLVREMELPRFKVGVVHGVQLVGSLAGQRRHVLVHVRQSGPDVGRRPAPVALVIHTDQVFFLHGKLHCHTSNSFFLVLAGAFFRGLGLFGFG